MGEREPEHIEANVRSIVQPFRRKTTKEWTSRQYEQKLKLSKKS
jgi:hypothetical protein